ncbi:hypothetical protein ACFXPA_15275 [Amycolatopsis sp. NPDC059090]|uniref:hypothetical protein n=1 Tax=unclassified Amycolatopsis TaxID=2618356 RepID=UPI00366EA689
MDIEDARQYLIAATGRKTLRDALEWLRGDRTLRQSPNSRRLFSALSAVKQEHPDADTKRLGEEAFRVFCRRQLNSGTGIAAGLIDVDTVVRPQRYRDDLALITQYTKSLTLVDISTAAVQAALRESPTVIDTLCAVAGITFKELKRRTPSVKLPSAPDGRWNSHQITEAFQVIDAIVQGRIEMDFPRMTAMRPVELLIGAGNVAAGWAQVHVMFDTGVSYENLLAQRVVGTAWGAHKNRTSSKMQEPVFSQLRNVLDTHQIGYVEVGRTAKLRKPLQDLVKQGAAKGDSSSAVSDALGKVKLVATAGETKFAIAVSVANDPGTANKSGASLAKLPRSLIVPAVAVLAGSGWADRTESIDVVEAFGGRVYTDLTLEALARELVSPGQS